MRAGRNLSKTSEKERDENNHSNSRKAWCVTSEEPVRPSNRSGSKKAAGFGSSNKDNPSDKQLRKTAKENKDEWMWQRFDEIMIGLTDFLNSEYKPRSLKATVEALLRTADREKGKRSKPMNSPGHLSSFYFKFGAPDQVTFRCQDHKANVLNLVFSVRIQMSRNGGAIFFKGCQVTARN